MPSHDHDRPISDRMHPFVYRAVVALALLLILSVWGFAGGVRTGYLLAVASLLVAMTLILSYVLRHIARTHRRQSAPDAAPEPLRQWLKGEFVSFGGREPARDAVISLLLPILAVSLGMLVFAIVLHLAVPGAA